MTNVQGDIPYAPACDRKSVPVTIADSLALHLEDPTNGDIAFAVHDTVSGGVKSLYTSKRILSATSEYFGTCQLSILGKR
jgi:hypothetical protein